MLYIVLAVFALALCVSVVVSEARSIAYLHRLQAHNKAMRGVYTTRTRS